MVVPWCRSAFPFKPVWPRVQLVINMGGEMLYILRQRLDAQSIAEEKSKKGECSGRIAALFEERRVPRRRCCSRRPRFFFFRFKTTSRIVDGWCCVGWRAWHVPVCPRCRHRTF